MCSECLLFVVLICCVCSALFVVGDPTRFVENVASLFKFGSGGEFGVFGFWFVGFVVGVVGCLYFDETLKLDIIVCCLTFERSDGCLYFFAFVLGFSWLSCSAALSKAAIIVGFRFGAQMIWAWFLACFMSLNVLLHSGQIFDCTSCLIGFVDP